MSKLYTESKKTAILAVPMILSQVSQHLVQVIDAAMIGRLGAVPLAASAFAANVFTMPLVFLFGIIVAISILSANAYGKSDEAGAQRVLRIGLIISVSMSIVAAILMSFTTPILDYMKQEQAVADMAKPYLIWLAWSTLPIMVFSALKNYSEAHSRPWLPLVGLLIMLVSNVFFNWVFIFGNLGAPRMELNGAGLATLLARLLSMVFIILVFIYSPNWDFKWITGDWFRLKREEYRNYLKIAVPSSFQITFEVSTFVLAAFMMGAIGYVTLAAHQIAINVAAMTFMVMLGLSFAVSVRASQYYGRGDIAMVRTIGLGGWLMSAAFMTATMICILIMRDIIPHWFIEDVEVIKLASLLLVMAAIFQIFDGIQIVMVSALRGIHDVVVPTVMILIAYYVFCLPLGYYLGFARDQGGPGIWLALVIGLALSASLLSYRFFSKTKAIQASLKF